MNRMLYFNLDSSLSKKYIQSFGFNFNSHISM